MKVGSGEWEEETRGQGEGETRRHGISFPLSARLLVSPPPTPHSPFPTPHFSRFRNKSCVSYLTRYWKTIRLRLRFSYASRKGTKSGRETNVCRSTRSQSSVIWAVTLNC